MRMTKSDRFLCAVMLASLIAAHVARQCGSGDEFFFLLLLFPALFFAFPLCRVFSNGIAAARDQMRASAAGSPWKAFDAVLRPRLGRWLVLWIGYFVVLELCLLVAVGGMYLTTSIVGTGQILGMIAACFLWAPRCRKLWTLVLLTALTSVPALILLVFLGAVVLDFLAPKVDVILGVFLYSPLIAAGCLFVAAVVSCWWALLRGNAWFRA